MKKLMIIVVAVLLSAVSLQAQQDTVSVREAVEQLEQSLTAKDGAALQTLLHDDLYFGHSNGWNQTKKEVIGDMESGSLHYRSFSRESLSIARKGKRAIVKEFVNVEGNRNGNDFKVRLYVIQEWVQDKKGWQLLLRQGAKL